MDRSASARKRANHLVFDTESMRFARALDRLHQDFVSNQTMVRVFTGKFTVEAICMKHSDRRRISSIESEEDVSPRTGRLDAPRQAHRSR